MPQQSWATQCLGHTSRFGHCPGMIYLPMFMLSIAGDPQSMSLHKVQQQQSQLISFHFPWKCFNCQSVSQFWKFVHSHYEMIQKRMQDSQYQRKTMYFHPFSCAVHSTFVMGSCFHWITSVLRVWGFLAVFLSNWAVSPPFTDMLLAMKESTWECTAPRSNGLWCPG